MVFVILLIFWALFFSLILSKIKKGKGAEWAKLFRIITLVFSISFFTYWFIKKSAMGIVKDSLALQVINKLPQPLDFYVINLNDPDANKAIETKHIGKIRPEYYRIEYLKMEKSNEYWIVGYLGKKNLVYFTQHSVPNKNIDQIIEVQNYINQSVKLSDIAKKQVEAYNYENIKQGIWVTLDFLLLFLNLVLLIKRK
jgi:energy-coupling factor transporter transmembrane protein EcfT